jgi:heme/copper-type cytochrome/quinol oxidase subunit 2
LSGLSLSLLYVWPTNFRFNNLDSLKQNQEAKWDSLFHVCMAVLAKIFLIFLGFFSYSC